MHKKNALVDESITRTTRFESIFMTAMANQDPTSLVSHQPFAPKEFSAQSLNASFQKPEKQRML